LVEERPVTLRLVIHDVPADDSPAATAFSEALFHIAPEHWPLATGAVLLATEVSPGYLRDHLLHKLRRAGAEPGLLMVTRVSADLAWHTLPAEGEAWLHDRLD
jgi:hypothetical protein